ncbi:MAG: radical SAM/SPASM domain-containing protein, partial [Candidatus Omnitrophota bacterium]
MIPQNNDMRIEVSTKCNYNCVICPHGKLTRRKETMSYELFREIVDKILRETKQYTTLTFPGMGEPLLDETLDEKIKYVKNLKPEIEILMLTNGYLLTPERFKSLEELGVTSIRVSLYGHDAETYSRVHGVKNKETFEMVKQNLIKICEIKNKTQLLLTFNVVEGVNDNMLENWIDFWARKADLVEVWRPHNWVDAKKYREVQGVKLKSCGRPFNGPLQVQVDGTVNMCCFDFDGKLTIGDLKTQTLKEIFSSPLYEKIKKCHESGNYKQSGLICENCDQRNSKKSDVMVYNSKFDINERVKMLSTTYNKVIN